MGEIGKGIRREDYAAIAAAARYINEHPKPPVAQRYERLMEGRVALSCPL